MIARTHRTCAARSRYDHECARIFALAAFAASICAFASGPPSEPAIPRAELPETHGTSAGKGEISRRPIPFEAPRGRVIADAADVTAIRELGRSDAEAGFNQLMETSWACVGQVPISSSLFEELMSGVEANRERAALAAATEMAAPVDLGEMPTIAAAAVADVLLNAVFDYVRSAFLDGFAGRGVPLRFYGFSGGISGRLSAVRIMPSGELPSPEHSHANEPTPWRPRASGLSRSESTEVPARVGYRSTERVSVATASSHRLSERALGRLCIKRA